MPSSSANNDEQYKQATKAVIDDAMRTHNLAPHLQNVLRDHKPVNDLLQKIVAESIGNNGAVKKALSAFLDDYDSKRKGKWVDRTVSFITGAIIVGVITYIVNKFR